MLDVYLYGELAAHLGRIAHSNYRLSYTPEWLASSRAVPLSTYLPLRHEPYTGDRVLRVLAGLLPDREEVVRRWAMAAGLPDSEPYGILMHYGEDVAGAAVFVRHGEAPEPRRERVRLSTADIAARIRGLRADSAAWAANDRTHRFSLAGAQGKFTLAKHGVDWYEPGRSEPSTHILKPGIDKYVDSDVLEHVVMQTLGRLGVPTAETRIEVFEDQRALLVTRFDRVPHGGVITRVHQEDLAQATGTPPLQKYEHLGGPGAADIAAVLRREVRLDLLEASLFVFGASLVYAWLVAHNDGHAKNYSLRLLPGLHSLTPLYDVNSYLPHLDPARIRARDETLAHEVALAFSINGKYKIGELGVAKWHSLARTLGLPHHSLVTFARQAATDLMLAVNSAIDTLPPAFQTETIARFREAAFIRQQSVLRVLGS